MSLYLIYRGFIIQPKFFEAGMVILTKKSCLLFLFSSVLAAGVILRIINLNNVVTRSPDEKIYSAQAKIITYGRVDGSRALVKEYNSNKKLWIFPPPTRVGYLWLVATVMRLANVSGENAGAYISFAFSIISLLLLIAVGIRFFNYWIALYALLFMSVSPLDLAIARRAWQDAMLGCFGLLLVYICSEITRCPRRLFWHILFIALGSYCLLIKESGIVVYGLCFLWLLWVFFVKEKSFSRGIVLISLAIVGIIISFISLAYAAGGFRVLLEVFRHVGQAMPTNAYVIKYQSDPWYYLLRGFWILTGLNALWFIACVTCTIFFKRMARRFIAFGDSKHSVITALILFAISFITVAALTPYCQNLRYVSAVFSIFYLLSGLGFWYIISFAKAKLGNFYFYALVPFVLPALILLAAGDYQKFKKIFVHAGIQDLSVRMIEQALP